LTVALLVPVGLPVKFAMPGAVGVWCNRYGAAIVYEVFWVLVAGWLFPRAGAWRCAVFVLAATCGLEFLQLWHPHGLERVRATFLGAALLGRAFDPWDFSHYVAGCAAGAVALAALRRAGGAGAIVRARTDAEFKEARRLFREYADFLGLDLCFQNFAEELTKLETMYGPPRGALLLARSGGAHVGCVGLRDLGGDVAEMKRLYVQPGSRGRGLGHALAGEVIRAARSMGYRAIRLDTIPRLAAAERMYRTLGFRDIPPYRHNPDPAAVFLELTL
jgi:ribosomal protein S18 acetylase RimI-like enzyme